MALGEAQIKPVVFISGSPLSDPKTEPTLRGTGFLIGFRFQAEPKQGLVYIVTAAHVVRPLGVALVRMHRPDGRVADHAINEWFFHPTEDIAVARLPPPYSEYDFFAVEAKDLVGNAEVEHPPQAGADVFVAGWLRLVPAMGDRKIPMVRSGSIGALYQDDIPMSLPDGTRLKVHAHLIDCQSFGGFSGSPCFVRYISGQGRTEGLEIPYPIASTLLLGMIGGHFDLQASVGLPEGSGSLKVPVAAGVAVVYPAEVIREVLDAEELAQERAEAEAQLEA